MSKSEGVNSRIWNTFIASVIALCIAIVAAIYLYVVITFELNNNNVPLYLGLGVLMWFTWGGIILIFHDTYGNLAIIWRCEKCRKIKRAVRHVEDPYTRRLYNDHTKYLLCPSCIDESKRHF